MRLRVIINNEVKKCVNSLKIAAELLMYLHNTFTIFVENH